MPRSTASSNRFGESFSELGNTGRVLRFPVSSPSTEGPIDDVEGVQVVIIGKTPEGIAELSSHFAVTLFLDFGFKVALLFFEFTEAGYGTVRHG